MSTDYHSIVIGHRRSHRKPPYLKPIVNPPPAPYNSSGLVAPPPANQALTVPGPQNNTAYVNIPANVRKPNVHAHERLNEPKFLREERDSFAENFHGIEYTTRNVKPWQWGVGAGALAFVAGIGFVEGVFITVSRGLSWVAARLVGTAGTAGTAGAVLSKISPGKNREIIEKAIQIGRGLPNFMDKVGALKQAVQSVMNIQNVLMKVDFINQVAYGGKGGYGIAVIDKITYVVKIEQDKIVAVIGEFR